MWFTNDGDYITLFDHETGAGVVVVPNTNVEAIRNFLRARMDGYVRIWKNPRTGSYCYDTGDNIYECAIEVLNLFNEKSSC